MLQSYPVLGLVVGPVPKRLAVSPDQEISATLKRLPPQGIKLCNAHHTRTINIFVLGLRSLLKEASLIICGALANFLQSFFVMISNPVSQAGV